MTLFQSFLIKAQGSNLPIFFHKPLLIHIVWPPLDQLYINHPTLGFRHTQDEASVARQCDVAIFKHESLEGVTGYLGHLLWPRKQK